MALAPRSWLIEHQLLGAAWNWWPTEVVVPEFLDSSGDTLTTLPALRFSFMGATEEPENSGNHNCEVAIELFGRLDPDNTTSTSWGPFAERVREHIETAGYVEQWITDDLQPSDLQGAVSLYGFTNTLVVNNIRLASYETEIDSVEGNLHHTWNLEIHLHQAPD